MAHAKMQRHKRTWGAILLWVVLWTGLPMAGLLAEGCGRSASAPISQRTDLLNDGRPLAECAGPDGLDRGKITLRVEKAKYRLTVLHAGKPIKAYPVVFGRNPTDDKRREGDGCTPEGRFRIRNLYPHRAWSYFLWLDYPTADSWRKHRYAKRRGLIRQDASIGGEVGIHGVPDGQDRLIESRINWTLGCISLRTEDIGELYRASQKGTLVEILP